MEDALAPDLAPTPEALLAPVLAHLVATEDPPLAALRLALETGPAGIVRSSTLAVLDAQSASTAERGRRRTRAVIERPYLLSV